MANKKKEEKLPVKEEFSEIFREGKPEEWELKKESKMFRNIVILMMGFVVLFLMVYGLIYLTKHFEVDGVKFNIDKTSAVGITFYNTYLPVNYNNSPAHYNFYLRKDPRILEKVEFNGTMKLEQNMVLNMTDPFNCNGDGIIAVANLLNLYRVVGTKVISDKNATCDPKGRYMHVNIQPGNETKIVEYKPKCYEIYVADCEILKATERFMLETFIYVNRVV